MSIPEILNALLLKPLQLLFEVIYMCAYKVIGNPGLSIILLSLAINLLVLPLYKRADALQEEERRMEARLEKGVAHIKKTFRGDERMMMLQTYYRQNHYKPVYTLRSAVSLLLQIPFFIAAYRFLSGLSLLQGTAFGPIADLGAPDGLLALGGMRVNLLPVLMTAVNLVSCVIFTKDAPLKSKLQLYIMALFFLFFLYDSPSGLVFYWTLNNVFSLVKTIFYKLKNPRKVLRTLLSLAGLALLVFALGVYRGPRIVVRSVIALSGLLLQLPMVWYMLRRNAKPGPEKAYQPNAGTFFACGLFLALFVGAYIPLSVIVSSAQEFVNLRRYESPVWLAANSFFLAAGTFVIWFGIFYWLASPRGKTLFERAMCVLAGTAVIDFMFFGRNMGNMNASLVYDLGVKFTASQILINGLVIAAAAAALYLAAKYLRKYIPRVAAIAGLAVAVMVSINAVNVNSQLEATRRNLEQSGENPQYSMSTEGKNVIVLMLDRGMGEFLPYIFQERPELQEQFAGFTVYKNVLSTGTSTNFGTPALLGGYEYTPLNLNLRDQEKLVDKHDEALKVMPVLFGSTGYDVTLFDPVYAGYSYTPDLTVFSDHPEFHTYITHGAFEGLEVYEAWKESNMRNFFLYGLMKISPLAIQRTIYDEGAYNSSRSFYTGGSWTQLYENVHKATGMEPDFLASYNVLHALPEITQIEQSEQNTFLFMTNDAPHDIMLLQTPDYTPSYSVDNAEYDEAHKDRFTVDGVTLNFADTVQYAHYHANMASMIQLGRWFDSMRENGVYDNTRIIIVSDHGRNLELNKDWMLDDGVDLEWFYAMLMVKDFDAKEFSFSDDFMMTADVPTLATKGIIENPQNPFTGKPISSAYKEENPVYIFYSVEHSILVNNGNQYLPGDWYRVENQGVHNPKDWVKVGTNTVLPDDLAQ